MLEMALGAKQLVRRTIKHAHVDSIIRIQDTCTPYLLILHYTRPKPVEHGSRYYLGMVETYPPFFRGRAVDSGEGGVAVF